jgi:hypothetical protein
MAHGNNVCGLTNGDILMRFPDDISCFFAVVRFVYEMSCLGVRVGGEKIMQRHVCES